MTKSVTPSKRIKRLFKSYKFAVVIDDKGVPRRRRVPRPDATLSLKEFVKTIFDQDLVLAWRREKGVNASAPAGVKVRRNGVVK